MEIWYYLDTFILSKTRKCKGLSQEVIIYIIKMSTKVVILYAMQLVAKPVVPLLFKLGKWTQNLIS